MRRRPERSYSSRHSRRRSHEKAKAQDRLGIMLLGAGFVAVAAVGIGFAATYHPMDVDKATGCPTGNQAPAAHTLVLVDATDKLNPAQIREARSLIQTEYMWLPIGGQLTVRGITADPAQASDIVICRVDDGSHANALVANKKYAQQRFQKTVGTKLQALYTELANAPVQDASPILETAADSFDRADFGPNVEARRLVIYSDFAQHSPLVTQYGRAPRLDEAAAAELERDMAGVEVRLHYVRRPALRAMQGQAHKDFWTTYFEDMGASVALGSNLLIGEDRSKDTWIG